MTEMHSPLGEKAATKVAKHAGESKGHWYTKEGHQISQVMKVDGSGYTKCTLTHARKLDLAPGCTTIVDCADKPQLTLWLQRQAILSALTLPIRDNETESQWLERVEHDMGETARKAAEEGSKIHAAVQAFYGGQSYDKTYTDHVRGAVKTLTAACGEMSWRAEASIVSRLGVATKIDMLSDSWIVNWKTKDGDLAALQKLGLYDDHAMQSAFELSCLTPRRAAIGFISRTHPGVTRIVEIPQKDLVRGMAMFRALLRYWQCKNSFRPSWASEEA